MNDLQTIFNNGVIGIRAQGGPSMHPDDNTCAYRGEGGRMCAIGHSIPLRNYHQVWDVGGGVNALDSRVIFALDLDDDVVPYKISLFQLCHDNAARCSDDDAEFFEMFEKEILRFAAENDLTVPV